MTVCYTVVIILFFFSSSVLVFAKFKSIVNSEVSKRVSELDLQFMTTINYYLDRVETDCTIVFCDEDIVSFNPAENGLAEYENTAKRNQIKKSLLELSADGNYNDFMIVYSDGSSVGQMSSGIADVIAEIGFEGISAKLNGKSDAWLYSLKGNSRKFYYLRKISDSSIFLLSAYADELSRIITVDNSLNDSTLYLADENGTIIYTCSDSAESGDTVPEEIAGLFDTKDGDAVINKKYIAASLQTQCGWQAITVAETPSLTEVSPLNAAALAITLTLLIIISVATGFLCCRKYTSSVLNDPNSEFIDPMTGVLNEYGLDERISELMETSIIGSTYAFILIRIKDYEQIGNSVSPRFRNNVRLKLIEAAENFFNGRRYSIGTASNGRIVVFADYSEFDIFKAHEELKKSCESFTKSFEEFYIGADGEFKAKVSIGVCIYPDHAEDFDELMEKADEALAKADKSEENCCVIYKPAKAVSK